MISIRLQIEPVPKKLVRFSIFSLKLELKKKKPLASSYIKIVLGSMNLEEYENKKS